MDKDCANDKITSVGPKKSMETNISKAGCFRGDKSFWHILPPII